MRSGDHISDGNAIGDCDSVGDTYDNYGGDYVGEAKSVSLIMSTVFGEGSDEGDVDVDKHDCDDSVVDGGGVKEHADDCEAIRIPLVITTTTMMTMLWPLCWL